MCCDQLLQVAESLPSISIETYIIPGFLALAGPRFYPKPWKENHILVDTSTGILTMDGKSFSPDPQIPLILAKQNVEKAFPIALKWNSILIHHRSSVSLALFQL